MKGIEENMLKLQVQDRGPQPTEVKQKASNGIASWFGLKKSKLPALRKTDATKVNEKREWKINIPSVGRDPVKVASRCKEGVEGLNISTLMEKAGAAEGSGGGEGLRGEVGQRSLLRGVMTNLRDSWPSCTGGDAQTTSCSSCSTVDGNEMITVPQRRLSFDCKTSKPMFCQQGDVISHTTSRDDMEKGSDRIGKITSDENLADSVHSQHFAGRGLSKARAGAERHSSGSPGRAGRRARTLDREPVTQEENYAAHKQLIPTIQYASALEGRGSAGVIREDRESHAPNMFSPRSKTWTFPNLKTAAGPAEVYLAVEEEEEEESFGSPFRASSKAVGPSSSRAADPGSLPVPAPSGGSRRGKTRAPSVPEVSRGEGGLELLRERPEEALSPSRPQVLETPESLSDSLYDSLSSCGSQG
ncbi:hypothetical protein F7725_001109 [Dissostichus mawsoni]|uniref:Nck-associated protein 5 C-terminal domain-containing protein n=1 Tax=Dissostichus mawsoni TaxID=36200 RepID=A0A7J5ZGB3_DISMA|nr:hypothetical protein F7725_001109 [Dissostichus mawsoni]